ncbi:MAG: hypothetical protein MHM6MM_009360, partial [Cercozoa sp. M6MM]
TNKRNNYNNRNCPNCPINGQLEVAATRRSKDVWLTNEGFFVPLRDTFESDVAEEQFDDLADFEEDQLHDEL